jgi:LuxR family maltose regulon positive regulatory protein
MDIPLLATKLYIPPPRSNLVRRPRLIERLNDGLHLSHKLTLITAPAGFGKTTLLSEWAAGLDLPIAWLSFDESDSDPRRAAAYLVAALRALPGSESLATPIGESFLDAVSTQLDARGGILLVEQILGSLINEIAALPQGFVLVLDDYHLIENPHTHEAVSFLLNHLPTSVHLVIASRAEPPLPIARLRARGQLTELNADDLRFTLDETAALLEQITDLNLTSEDIARLETRTEGWIAGLQMTALALQGLALRGPSTNQEATSAFIAAFAGDDRYIMDYLVEEVLSRQPETVQTFLLQTSILERLTTSLCNAITKQTDSQAILEKLERNNLFIFPLDNRRQWYRYHHLFAELLHHRLCQQTAPQDLAALHHRAADWYEANSLSTEAIDHALKAPDLERAVRLIEQNALETLQRNEIDTLLKWLEPLDQDILQSRPLLPIVHAWIAITRGQFDKAEGWARTAEVALAKNGWQRGYLDEQGITRRWMRGNIDAIRSTATSGVDRISLARRALESLPADDVLLRSVIALNLGEAYAGHDDVAAAREAFRDAIAIGQEGGNIISTLAAMSGLGQLRFRLGDLHGAAEVCQQAVRLGIAEGEPAGHPVPASGNAHRLLAECFYEWNDLDAALHHATEAVECCRRWGHFTNLAECYLELAHVQQMRGDSSGVHQAMAATTQLSENAAAQARRTSMPMLERDVGYISDLIEATQAHLWLLQDNVDAAAQWMSRWIDEHNVPDEDPLPYLVRPRLLIAQCRYAEALPLLKQALQKAEARQRIHYAIHILTKLAHAYHAQGNEMQALTSLEQALRLAEPGGYIRAFIDRRNSLETLLRRMRQPYAIAPAYVGRILAAFCDESEQTTDGDNALLEQLSDREMEVLRLIAAQMSNQEIADALVISINTVKTHIRRLYGKLSVGNRLAALERARDLGLL